MAATRNAFKIQKVAPNVDLVSNITLGEARAKFGNRMFDPGRVHNFALEDIDRFNTIMSRKRPHSRGGIALKMGIGAFFGEPIGESVQHGNLLVYLDNGTNGENRLLIIPENKLVEAGRAMSIENILRWRRVELVLKGGYNVDQSGNTYTAKFSKEALYDNLAQYLGVYHLPDSPSATTHNAVEGMAVGPEFMMGKVKGMPSNLPNPDTLVHQLHSILGSIVRFKDSSERLPHYVIMGYEFGTKGSVLVQAEK